MDSDGDFYIGNTKYSAQSGEQKTFDVPTPTVTGEDPNRLSVVFDEVIVKERILVEGGTSGQILSQFDGPVTFNGDVRMNRQLILNNNLRVVGKVDFTNTNRAEDATDKNAALRVAGGVAIGRNLIVGEELDVKGNLNVVGISTFNGEVKIDTGIRPDTDEGAYLGTAALPFSEAHIDEIRIGVSGDGEIDTATGNLTLDSAGGTTTVDDNLVVTGTSNLQGDVTAGSNLTVTDDLTVNDTANFAGNTVQITSNTVTATNFRGRADDTENVRVDSGTGQIVMVDGTGSSKRLETSGNITYNGSQLSVSGKGSFTDDVIAFASDDRLKTNKIALTGALDKVCSLNGFTFNFNETAGELGFNTNHTYVGVSAQDVQKVLPEAVYPAPASDKYITVQYEKIVPLLIEAIKELSDKVSALEDKLNN